MDGFLTRQSRRFGYDEKYEFFDKLQENPWQIEICQIDDPFWPFFDDPTTRKILCVYPLDISTPAQIKMEDNVRTKLFCLSGVKKQLLPF